ncbi:MAG: LytTR family DNA-binding domain-containing protein [Oscillospiraceae bacterium]|nr:LytTR family DNA-binding domain-containing protein [Oscillospiraceae bacterium]
MKITVEHSDVAENEIVLRCASLDEECLHILALLNSQHKKLCVWKELGTFTFLMPTEILYCETVDDKTFVYTPQEVYQTALSLAELETRYEAVGLLRASKSMVVNLHAIATLTSRAGSRIDACMQNGEIIVISRHYAPLLRERLGLL